MYTDMCTYKNIDYTDMFANFEISYLERICNI